MHLGTLIARFREEERMSAEEERLSRAIRTIKTFFVED